jgi:hypothetical protein
MIVESVGRLFRVLARIRPGEPGQDLDHVGAELIRLGQPVPRVPRISR